ncbi:hypothetical protein SAMN05444483_105152 [Salegentibacter echinorum]|uniref:Polysaccharide lyase 14 domain-containing protein n=1 Tax=Salegentibacter echinorum TaxID=1073325 RepID=A0A1M5HHR6_SALEC|nr:hypothetical protein [Salegentibacter echinorum]SHG15382.1 hypothetical protein SAMN05444483_105152 [Salegentibacter echinorum]
MRNFNKLSDLTKRNFFPVLISLISFTSIGCQSEDLSLDDNMEDTLYNEPDPENDTTTKSSINDSRWVGFNTGNTSINSETSAENIFDNKISGWDTGVAKIESNKLKITLPERAGTSNGMECRLDVTDNPKYQLYFDVKFQDNFDFSRGGKLGFGFAIGDGVTGGRWEEAVNENKGGSFRVMWRGDSAEPYLFPYVYYKDMQGFNGNDFKHKKFNITDNRTYRVRLTIKTNTSASKANGYAKMEVKQSGESNYTKVWETSSIRWSGNSSASKRNIKTFYFSTFRGGKTNEWDGNNGSQSIYFDNLKWYQID